MSKLFIQDKKGKVNGWLIEHELDNTYQIFFNTYITEVRKDKCFNKDGKLYYSDIIDTNYDNEPLNGYVSEECSNCGRQINARFQAYVDDNDNYVCGRCANKMKSNVKKALRI